MDKKEVTARNLDQMGFNVQDGKLFIGQFEIDLDDVEFLCPVNAVSALVRKSTNQAFNDGIRSAQKNIKKELGIFD